MRASLKAVALLAGLGIVESTGAIPIMHPAARAATPAKPVISEEASTAVAQMGKSLLANQFSLQAKTLRVYVEPNGQPLHIAHTMRVVVRRPDRMVLDVTGDDGSSKMIYDGKTAVVYGPETKKYTSTPVPNTIQGMLEAAIKKGGVDFPLADFLTDTPDRSFLFGVTSGREINTVTIDGTPCRHLLFTQSPGIELELWVEKNDRALPRRLIVTYRSEPGQPSFVAELFDWNFSIHPTDADFVFQPPEGAMRTEPMSAGKPAAATKKGTSQ